MRIAEASGSRKQALRSKVLLLHTKLEVSKLRFSLYRSGLLEGSTREDLIEQMTKEQDNVQVVVKEERALHRASKGEGMSDTDFTSIFLQPVDSLENDWKELENAIRKNSFYSSVTYEEKRQIVAALMSSYDLCEYRLIKENIPSLIARNMIAYSGHFYQCPNGHTFVIGDVSLPLIGSIPLLP